MAFARGALDAARRWQRGELAFGQNDDGWGRQSRASEVTEPRDTRTRTRHLHQGRYFRPRARPVLGTSSLGSHASPHTARRARRSVPLNGTALPLYSSTHVSSHRFRDDGPAVASISLEFSTKRETPLPALEPLDASMLRSCPPHASPAPLARSHWSNCARRVTRTGRRDKRSPSFMSRNNHAV